MEKRIADLILEYESKLIDQTFFDRLFNILVTTYELEEFVSKCIINNKLPYKACYTPYGTIEINCNKINRELLKKSTCFPYQYLLYVRVILHEFSHVLQVKKKHQCDDIESRIIAESEKHRRTTYWALRTGNYSLLRFLYKALKANILEKRYYRFDPQERLANIESAAITASVAKILDQKNLHSYYIQEYWGAHTQGYNQYKKMSSPTKLFIDKLNPQKNDWFKIEEITGELDLITRLKLGLPATREELKQIKRTLVRK